MFILQVIAYTSAGDSFLVTSNYVTPARSTIQGSYLDLPVMTNAARFELLLTGNGSTYGYVGLTEVEIYAGGENMYDRYVFIWVSTRQNLSSGFSTKPD